MDSLRQGPAGSSARHASGDPIGDSDRRRAGRRGFDPGDIGALCSVATSVHGGEPPVNQLTLIVTREVAYTIAADTLDARDFMLTLLDRWMTDRNVRVARVEVFYGRAHLATAETRVFGGPTVEFH